MSASLRYELREQTAYLSLTQPAPGNSIDLQLATAPREPVARSAADDARVVVLEAEGP